MIAFIIFVFFLVPETKNKTFEEIASKFQKGGAIQMEKANSPSDEKRRMQLECEKEDREGSQLLNKSNAQNV